MSVLITILLAAAAGYVAAVNSWPRLRPWLVGIETEIDNLRERARVLEAKLRG
jgi:hypothetical protein